MSDNSCRFKDKSDIVELRHFPYEDWFKWCGDGGPAPARPADTTVKMCQMIQFLDDAAQLLFTAICEQCPAESPKSWIIPIC